MSVTTVNDIQDHCGLAEGPATKVFNYVDSATRKIKELISSDVYEQVAGDQGDANYDPMQRAESYLCLYFALPFLNLRPTEIGGLVKTVGYGEMQTEQLMGLGELKAYQIKLYQMAIGLLERLITQIPEDPDKAKKADIQSYDAGIIQIA